MRIGKSQDSEPLFVKTPPSDPVMRQRVLDQRMDATEVDFYCKVLNMLQKFEVEQMGKSLLSEVIPKCYLGYYDKDVSNPGSLGFVLALEDLVEQGFTMFDVDKGMNHQEIRQMLDTIAVLHAVSYTFATVNSVSWPEYFPTMSKFSEHMRHPFMKSLLDETLNVHLRSDNANRGKRLANFVSGMGQGLAGLLAKDSYKCLVHADLWTTNIMHGKDGACKLFDFQFATCGDPMFDVSLVLLFNSNITEVKDDIDDLLQHYFMTFNRIIASLDRKGTVPMLWKSFDALKANFEREGYLSALMFGLMNCLLLDKYPGLRMRIEFIVDASFERGLL